MTDTAVLDQPIVSPETALSAPVETPPIIETAAPELSHIYQPTDDEGRPIGGKQVIKYRTTEELVGKMEEQNVLLIRKLRKETRNNRLGISENDEISPEAIRFTGPVEFQPRELTDEEKVMLSRDLLDPSKALEAQAKIFEASVGVSPEALRNTLVTVQQTNMQIQANQQANDFVADNPDYFKCRENFEAITGWMSRHDLAPVKANFQSAYDALKKLDILVQSPGSAPRPEPSTPPAAAQPPVPDPPPAPAPPQSYARVDTGLSRSTSDSTGTPAPVGSEIVYKVTNNGQERSFVGRAAIEAMPGEEYRLRMRDPAFVKAVNRLDQAEKEAAAARQRARMQ